MDRRALPPRALQGARRVKHAAWLASLAARRTTAQAAAGVRDPYVRRRYAGARFDYRRGMFRRSFLDWDATTAPPPAGPLPRVVHCFWTGDNELTPARRHNLELMRESMGVPVRLVTPADLDSIVVPQHPLHPAYDGLSLVHRADYLRAYVMHHHGGGYADIKAPQGSWVPVFDAMDADEEAWTTGYPERSSIWVAQYPGRLGRELRRWHHTLPGGGGFVVRPHTPLTAEWLAEVERRLDYYRPLVEANPGGVRGEDPSYPISWNRLLAQVAQPLYLKHHRHVRVDARLAPASFENHR